MTPKLNANQKTLLLGVAVFGPMFRTRGGWRDRRTNCWDNKAVNVMISRGLIRLTEGAGQKHVLALTPQGHSLYLDLWPQAVAS
jgi:hypothetical protein